MLNKRTEQAVQMAIALFALFGLLAYTFVHTGALFARYVHPWPVGYLAAFGVEATVFGLSFRLATLKRSRSSSWVLAFVLSFALIVSAFANIAEGYYTMFGEQLTWLNIGSIDPVQAVVGVAATGLISVMVFAISEIIGGDVDQVVKQAERAQRKAERAGRTPERQANEPANIATNGSQSYKEKVFALLDTGEQIGPAEMARRTGAAKGTACKWIRAWEGERGRTKGERVQGNGSG